MSEDMVTDDQYFHSLDSIARVYNSQMTAHVGYTLGSFFGYFAVFSALQSILSPPDFSKLSGIAAVLLTIAWFLPFLPLSPIYQFARVQYFVALSYVVWDHMGVTNPFPDSVRELKKRAYRIFTDEAGNRTALAIDGAVMRMFEALLYLSCRKTKDDDKRWQKAFHFEEYVASGRTLGPSYKRSKVLRIPLTWLLRIAYRRQISYWKRKRKEGEQGYLISELFRECFDC